MFIFRNIVKCETCSCLIEKTDAQAVKIASIWGSYSRNYCPIHKKPYSRIVHLFGGVAYYGEIRMNEDGTPYVEKKRRSRS